MSQIECWVPRHLPVRLGFFGFSVFFGFFGSFRFFRFLFFWLNTKGQYWKVFFPKNVRSNRKPKKPKKPMSQIECWVPRHLPVRLGFFVFFRFFRFLFFWLNTKGQYWKVFFPKNVRSNRKPKKPKKPMSQIECWVPRHLPVRLGVFGFFGFFVFFGFWF